MAPYDMRFVVADVTDSGFAFLASGLLGFSGFRGFLQGLSAGAFCNP